MHIDISKTHALAVVASLLVPRGEFSSAQISTVDTELSTITLPDTSRQDEISRIVGEVVQSIRQDIYSTVQQPSHDEVVACFIRALKDHEEKLLGTGQSPHTEELFKNLALHWEHLGLARITAEQWAAARSECPSEDQDWTIQVHKQQGAGVIEFRIGNLFYSADEVGYEPRTTPVQTLRITYSLTPEQAKAVDVNLLWGTHHVTLSRIVDDQENRDDPTLRRSTEFEIHGFPQERTSAALASSWLEQAIQDLSKGETEACNFTMEIKSRVTSMTFVPDGNRENSPIMRNWRTDFVFNPGMARQAEKLADGSLQRRVSQVVHTNPDLTNEARIVADGIQEVVTSLDFWQRESAFHHIVGRQFDISSELVSQMISVSTENGSRRAVLVDAKELALKPGELLVVDLFAMWCGPCLAQMPELDEFQKSLEDKNVRVLSLCFNDTPRDIGAGEHGGKPILEWVAAQNLVHPFAIAQPGLAKKVDTPVVPCFIVMDHTGKALYAITPTENRDELERIKNFICEYRNP